jgi:alpha-L-rhamnosidase
MRRIILPGQLFLVLFLQVISGTQFLTGQSSPAPVCGLKTEYHINPLGIDILNPRLSWILSGGMQNLHQTAWQVQVATSRESLEKGTILWDSEKVTSGNSIQNPYGGPALESRQRYYWRVRIWDNTGSVSSWSEPAYWEMGLAARGDWQALWIRPELDQDPSVSQPAPMLRSEFETSGKIVSARAYVTAHGFMKCI